MIRFVFLCAGRGRRMRDLTQDRCKAMVRTASGKSILAESLDNLASVCKDDAQSVCVIGGYQFEKLKDWLHIWSNGSGREITARLNPAWAEYGPLGSLLQLQDTDFAVDGLCVLNGDTVYDSDVFDAALKIIRARKNALICSETQVPESDAIFVRHNGQSVIAAGKVATSPPPLETYLVSAGCMVLSGPTAISALHHQVVALKDPSAREALKNNPWHSLVSLIASETQMTAEIVPETSWQEYDTPECLSVRTTGMKASAQ